VDLQINWLSSTSSLGLFDPKYYGYSPILPNLWAFLATSVSFAWFVLYARSILANLTQQVRKVKQKYAYGLCMLAFLLIYAISNFIVVHIATLITNSSEVNSDITNLLSF